ncbi:MAG: hypothetical protein JOZ60_03480 [Verrucomicrobia bacterium]|nr:hypothetical protein [Verrucomicrobiota bacterium]
MSKDGVGIHDVGARLCSSSVALARRQGDRKRKHDQWPGQWNLLSHGKNSRASQECKQVFDKQKSKHIETCQRHGRHFGGHTKKEPPFSEMKLSDQKLVANYREIVLAAFQNVEDELAAWCGSLVDR